MHLAASNVSSVMHLTTLFENRKLKDGTDLILNITTKQKKNKK